MTLRLRTLLSALLMLATAWPLEAADRLYVVERERTGLAVLDGQSVAARIDDLGSMHHATMKFHRGFGYVLSRDGFVSKIDLTTNRVLAKVKVGQSGIGIDFQGDHILVANYDPGTVMVLDEQLKVVKEIPTGSRNVGIKVWGSKVAFALMDLNAIWVLDADKGFEVVHRIETKGKLPFDALLAGSRYVVGFFQSANLGVLELDTLKFREITLESGTAEPVLKVPHFGMWGIRNEVAFIPAVGQRRLLVMDLKTFKIVTQIALPGLPVFAVLSPDQERLVVNYSGDTEDFLTVIDAGKYSIIKHFNAGRRILHMRFGLEGETLYGSSYFDNSVKAFDVRTWELRSAVDVATPSGIFVQPRAEGLRR